MKKLVLLFVVLAFTSTSAFAGYKPARAEAGKPSVVREASSYSKSSSKSKSAKKGKAGKSSKSYARSK